ncbi:MAG: family transcriptional regulator, cyclic receptor protein [Actinomycetota bacterium]|nr:family transcriptional regulator, cyclic receptor protein [Actinomycetota bacterium]
MGHVRTTITGVEIAALLGEADLFAGFDEAALGEVAATAELRSLRRNDLVFDESSEPDELYVVRSGRIAIANTSVDGRESVMALMEPGDLFGEMPLLDGGRRSAGARALEPSELVAVPYGVVEKILKDRPELLWGVVRLLAQRLRTTDAALADSVFLDVTGRTAKRLLELAGDADEFVLPVTQEELAGMVGASRERVNKALSAFIRLGWLEQADRRYRITDREQLSRRAR